MIFDFIMFDLYLSMLLLAGYLLRSQINKIKEWLAESLLFYLAPLFIESIAESFSILVMRIRKRWTQSIARKWLLIIQPYLVIFMAGINLIVYVIWLGIYWIFLKYFLFWPFRVYYSQIASFFSSRYSKYQRFWWLLLTAIILFLWNLALFLLWKYGNIFFALYGWGFLSAFIFLGIKNIKLIFLKLFGKVFGALVGVLIRRYNPLVDWIKRRQEDIKIDFIWFKSSFDNPVIIERVYLPLQLWLWGTLLVLGLL